MKPLEPNPNAQPYTPEILAELLAAADRRINALSREVERSIGSRTSAPSAGDGAAPQPATPPVSPIRLKLPAMPDVRAVVSRLTARWWRQGLGVVAVAAALAAGAALFSGSSPAEEREPADAAAAAPSEPAAADNPGSTPAAVTPTAVRQSTSALTMTLSANAPCWIRAVADGVQTLERMLKVGETVEVHAQDQVVLRVGDAGALSVSVNGRAATTVGPRGQVVTRRFSRRDYANSAAD